MEVQTKLRQLCSSLRELSGHVQKLSEINTNMVNMNATFYDIFQGMQVQYDCSSVLRPKVNIDKELVHTAATAQLMASQNINRALIKNNRVSGESSNYKENVEGQETRKISKIMTASKEKPKVMTKRMELTSSFTDHWKWRKGAKTRLPKKYQSLDEVEKMESIMIYIKNSSVGVYLSDLVKYSGLSVIKCKEMVQTLVKLEQITRTRDAKGFLYCTYKKGMIPKALQS